MSQQENQFRNSIHRHLNRNLIHQEKMHNPFRGGTFDDWYSANPNDLWIEYKYQPKVAAINLATSGSPSLSALQYQWGTQRFHEGRNVAVIVGMPYGGVILKFDEWQKRIPILEVESRILKRKQLAEIIAQFVTTPQNYAELWELADAMAS